MAYDNTIRRTVKLCCVWLAVLASFALQLLVVNNSLSWIPQSICYTAQGGINLDFEDVDRLGSDYKVSMHATVSGYAMTDMDRTPISVDVNLTDAAYGELTAMRLINGSYFVVSAVPEENMVIVIPTDLALQLYKTYDAVGRRLILNQQTYTVSGVYKPNPSPFYKIANTATMQVYIPFSAYSGYDDVPNKRLLLSDGTNRFSDNIINDVRTSTKSWFATTTSDNFSDASKMVAESIKVTLFLCGSTAIVLIGWIMMQAINTAIGANRVVRKRVIAISVAVVSVAAIVGILILCRFEPYIPPQYIPADNIFDIKFYIEGIMANIQSHNAVSQLNPLFYYCSYMLVATGLHAIVTWVMCIVAVVMTYKRLKTT